MRNRNLQAKMDQFAPGMPEDTTGLPTLLYQVLEGRVHTLLTFPDGSSSHGEVALADLEAVVGGAVERDGWYTASGAYLGEQPPGSLVG